MLRAHVAAGLDPAEFWTLTLREWVIRMDGAEARVERERVTDAVTAWVGANADHKGLLAWLEATPGKARAPMTPEAVERMLHHTAAGLPEMSMERYLQMKQERL